MRLGVIGAFAVVSLSSGSIARADTLQGAAASAFVLGTAVPNLNQPTSFAFLPDGRMVISQKTGEVVLSNLQGTERTIGTFPVDTVSEKGLLNVLVHPSFATNRTLIFYYSRSSAAGGTDADRHRVVTVQMNTSDDLDMTTETILVRGLRGPFNHDGGALAIGPDGRLYIGVGDTGCNSNQDPDPPYTPTNYFGTCLTNPNGKILRVELNGTIPSTNPLVGNTAVSACSTCGTDPATLTPAAAREDIWAWGFRNPWRFWFDNVTGNLWVGDVGEITYEEIDIIPQTGGGKHYGWPWREGGQGWPVTQCTSTLPNTGDCVDPQYYCQRGTATPGIDDDCQSITGGLIVDSCQFPLAYRGKYYFADNARGWIALLDTTSDRSNVVAGSRQMIIDGISAPVQLGVGPDGALYYAAAYGGAIQRMAPITPATCPSGTGGAGNSGGVSGGGGTAAGTGATSNGGASGGGGATSSAGGVASGGDTCCAGGTGPGGTAADASIGGGNAASRDSGGCGCALGKRSPSPAVFAVLFAAVALTYRRRRS